MILIFIFNFLGKFLVRFRNFDKFLVFELFNGIFDNIFCLILEDKFFVIELIVFIVVFFFMNVFLNIVVLNLVIFFFVVYRCGIFYVMLFL